MGAKSVKMMEEKVFAIIIWALVYATIFAPLVFRKVLARYLAKSQRSNPQEVQEPVSPKSSELVHRASGHFPDLEEEENRRAQRKHSKEREQMALSLQEKDEEIARLRDALTRKDSAVSGELTTTNDSSANEGAGDGT